MILTCDNFMKMHLLPHRLPHSFLHRHESMGTDTESIRQKRHEQKRPHERPFEKEEAPLWVGLFFKIISNEHTLTIKVIILPTFINSIIIWYELPNTKLMMEAIFRNSPHTRGFEPVESF